MTEKICLSEDSRHEILDFTIPEEKPLSIYINGSFYATAMISPELEREFILGHLYSEGFIRGLDEIKELTIEGNIAEVELKRMYNIRSSKLILSGCGSAGLSFLSENILTKINVNHEIPKEMVIRGIRETLNSALYRITRGVHKSVLISSEFLYSAEDIGRHNALDKALGLALTNEHDLSCFCASTTGRISSEMALKCLRANIPVLVSKTAATKFAVEIALKGGLTLVAFALPNGKMKVLSNGERLV